MTPEHWQRVRRIQARARRAVSSLLSGGHRSPFKGSGLLFDEVREYADTDDARLIDWNVTARLNAPFVKRFVEERQAVIWLVVDLSSAMDMGSRGRSRREVAAELAALLAYAAVGGGDRVGLLGVGVGLSVRPGTRAMQADRIIREVAEPRSVRATAEIWGAALEGWLRTRPRRCHVMMIGGFAALPPAEPLRLIGARHDLTITRISDPWDRELPDLGRDLPVEDVITGECSTIRATPKLRTEYARLAAERDANFAALARSARARIIDVDTLGGHFDQFLLGLRAPAPRRA